MGGQLRVPTGMVGMDMMIEVGLVRKSLWGVEAYKLSAEFVHVVGSLLVPMYFLLQNTLSRIPGTAFILVFCGVRGFCQFHTPLLL